MMVMLMGSNILSVISYRHAQFYYLAVNKCIDGLLNSETLYVTHTRILWFSNDAGEDTETRTRNKM